MCLAEGKGSGDGWGGQGEKDVREGGGEGPPAEPERGGQVRAGGPDSPNSPAAASGPGFWGRGGSCSPSPSARATLPREQGQGQPTGGGTEGRPQGDWRMANNRRTGGELAKGPQRRVHRRRTGDRPPRGGWRSAQCGEGRPTFSPGSRAAPRGRGGGSPTAGGVGGDSQRRPWPS